MDVSSNLVDGALFTTYLTTLAAKAARDEYVAIGGIAEIIKVE